MNGLLFYFSGTGNTKWAADRFKESFEKNGCTLSLINIENSYDVNLIKNCDFIIFGFPVHAECPPRIFMNFLKNFPESQNENIKCIVYCSLAATNAAGLAIASKKLLKKGYNVSVEIPISLWSNFFFAMGKEKSSEEMNENLEAAKASIDSCVEMFLKGEKKSSPVSGLRMASAIIVEKLYYAGIPILSKNLSSTDECIKCNLCVKRCPKHNITLDDKHAVFHKKCMMCSRCIHLCPKNAIRYKDKKINQVQKSYINNIK